MATISNNTIVSLIDTQTNSGTVLLPKTSDIPYRAILFKDLYGTFDTKPLTLNTQSPDVFEDGTSVKRFNDKFTYLTLYADTSHSKWVILNGTQNNSITVSTLNGVQTGYISSLNVNSLTFGPGNGWLDLTALRAILVSTIQIDAGIGNFSSISGNGSQIVNLNAISSLSLQSTVTGLGTVGYISSSQLLSTTLGLGNIYLSTNIVPSSILGLGTFGYISTTQLQSTVTGLGTTGYLSTNIVPSSILGLGTFGYISTTQLQSTVRGLGTAGYLSTNIVPSSIVGLGTLGYVSSIQLLSTTLGLGNIYLSTNIVPSTIVGLGTLGYLSTNIVPSTITGLGTTGYLSTNIVPSSILGLGTFGYISTTQLQSTVTGLGTAGYLSSSQLLSTTLGLGNIYLSTNIVPSTILGLGTFGYVSSSQLLSTTLGLGNIYLSTNIVPSTILGLGTFGYISTTQLQSTVRGLGTVGYISTNIVPSTILGLGTFGYISTTQLQSTVTGLGNIYMSSFNGSTNFISSGEGLISTLTVNSLTFGPGNGWLDLTALRAILVSTIQIDAGIGNFSSISGNGSQIVALNAISSLSLISTVTGLGTAGYISTIQLQSTVRGLGNIYMSSFNGSTTFLSTAVGNISSLTVNSLTVGTGLGYVDFGAIRAVIVSSIQTNTGLLNVSSIIGDTIQIHRISTGNLFAGIITTRSVSTVNISSASNYTSVLFANSYNGLTLGGNINMNGGVFPTTPGIRDLGSSNARWNNFWVSTISSIHTTTSTLFVQTNIIASTINTSTIGVHRLTGPDAGFNTFTNNLYPLNTAATVGYGSNFSNNGYYNQGNFRSTFTNVIQPATDSVQHANVVRINGTVSTNTLATYFLQGNSPFGRFVYTDSLLPNGNVGIGNAVVNTFASIWGSNIRTDTIISRFGDHPQSTVRIQGTLSTGILNVSTIFAQNVNASTILASTIITPSISTNNISTIRLSVSSINSHLIPAVDNTYDLGSAISKWRDLYVGGTSIHLGNQLVLSEDDDGFLSTNKGIIVPFVQATSVSTSQLTAANFIIRRLTGIPFTTIGFNTNDEDTSYFGLMDETTKLYIWNVSGNDIKIQANTFDNTTTGDIFLKGTNIKTDGILDLSYNEIIDVKQITNASSVTTNLCLPTSNFITDSNTATFSNDLTPQYIQILTYTRSFQHIFLTKTFPIYKVHFSFSGETDDSSPTGTNYFYFTLTRGISECSGITYNSITPYKLQANILNNITSFNYTDIFDLTPICNADTIDVKLYAVSDLNTCNYYYKKVKCFVVTEPVV
jgi:hypothetical protein